MTVRQPTLRLKPEPLQDLHLGDDERVLEVVELGGEVVHRGVGLERCGWRVGRVGAVGDEGREVGIAVDDVADPESRLFEFRSEEEGAHPDVLCACVSLACYSVPKIGQAALTRIPKCLSEVTNQKRWKST